MYFSYSDTPNKDLPYHYLIQDNYLSTAEDLDQKIIYGYKLGDHGGNYVEFTQESIKFSFHKDFKLISNDNFIITNLNVDGIAFNNDLIEYCYDGELKHYPYKTIKETSYSKILTQFKTLLLENIKTFSGDNMRVAYTAGLDSGLVAYLAHDNNLDFTTVIHQKYTFKNLPFKKIEYHPATKLPDFDIVYGPVDNVKFGFYQDINNNLITGYYGDLCGLHHNQMYHQSKHLLTTKKKHILYDRANPNEYDLFNSKDDILFCVRYLNGQQYFRHWFSKFQILDPYRDPRLFEILFNLKLNDLILQLGTGMIQKDIVRSLNNDWLNNLCDFKNDYAKFN